MPTYDYMCNECKCEYEAFHTIASRHNEICPECGGEVHIVPGIAAVHTFNPHYSTALGTYLKSATDKKRIMRERGLEEVGSMSVEDVEKEARRAKAQEDAKRDREPVPQRFLDTYNRAKVQNG